MRNYYLFFLAFILLANISCNQSDKTKIKQLEQENKILAQSKINLEKEVNDYFETLNSVEENIKNIKKKQHIISVNPLRETTPNNIRSQVKDDIDYLNELIENNETKLDSLEKRLSKSSLNLVGLKKTVAHLTQELKDEKQKVRELSEILLQKNILITNLEGKVDSLQTVEKNNEQKIKEQDRTIHSVWYAIGSKKELEENKIITSQGFFQRIFSKNKVLQDDFNKKYFTRLDIRTTNSIPLYTSKKIKVLTNHSASSYEIKKYKKSYILTIKDKEKFWEVSRYLVVEVKS